MSPDDLKALNDMGVLTSRYDIYQDAMNPENFRETPLDRSRLDQRCVEKWRPPHRQDGQWVRGWEVEAKDGPMIPCGVLCDRQALAYAKRRIPPELATHPYRCRFIDTTTATPVARML